MQNLNFSDEAIEAIKTNLSKEMVSSREGYPTYYAKSFFTLASVLIDSDVRTRLDAETLAGLSGALQFSFNLLQLLDRLIIDEMITDDENIS